MHCCRRWADRNSFKDSAGEGDKLILHYTSRLVAHCVTPSLQLDAKLFVKSMANLTPHIPINPIRTGQQKAKNLISPRRCWGSCFFASCSWGGGGVFTISPAAKRLMPQQWLTHDVPALHVIKQPTTLELSWSTHLLESVVATGQLLGISSEQSLLLQFYVTQLRHEVLVVGRWVGGRGPEVKWDSDEHIHDHMAFA